MSTMSLRLPRPFKAAKSFVDAAQGNGPTLYRITYETDNGAQGVLVWLENVPDGPALVYNSEQISLDARQFAVTANNVSTVHGERVPLVELVREEDAPASATQTVTLPAELANTKIPAVDNKDAITG